MAFSKDQLKRHKVNMRATGFERLAYWVHPDLVALVIAKGRPGECGGRTLERLLLGEARQRPLFRNTSVKASP